MSQDTHTFSLSVSDAKEKILASIHQVDTESIHVIDSGGRVLAASISSPSEYPFSALSSMDGFAVISSDLLGVSPDNPAVLEVVSDIPAGVNPAGLLRPGQSARIMTGAVVPEGADAVIPVEYTDQFKNNKQFEFELPENVRIYRQVSKGDFIRPRGQDIHKGDLVLTPGRILKPQDVGLLAMLGFGDVLVYRRPKIAMISTGDELVAVGTPIQIGQVHDSNAYTLSSQILRDGGTPYYLGIARDRRESVKELLEQAYSLNVDMIVTTAGVSVGAFDFVREVVEQNGELGFWKVNIRPGKPLVFGHYRGVPFIGLPGNPVSAFVGYEVFIRPALQKLSGGRIRASEHVRVILSEPIESDGRESYLRGIVEKRSGDLKARPLGHQGSGNLLSLVRANALLIIPSEVKSLPSGAEVEAWLISDVSEGI